MNLDTSPKALLGLAVVALTACSNNSSQSMNPVTSTPSMVEAAMIEQGKQIFRFDTFGDETQWTDVLRLHEVIRSAVDPTTALSVGLKVTQKHFPPRLLRGSRTAVSA